MKTFSSRAPMTYSSKLSSSGCPAFAGNGRLASPATFRPRRAACIIGGVNVAFLDSHVDFIRNEIDPLVFANLIDIRDSEVVSNDGQ